MNLSFNSDPTFTIFTGPMFGSKTSKLLSCIDRLKYQGRVIASFKPQMDDRYDVGSISTHSGLKIDAINVRTGEDILDYLSYKTNVSVVAVDEAFMIDGCAEALIKLFRQGKSIIVSSLQLSASGRPFSEMKEMFPWATNIEVCPAICPMTGRDAFYTHRKIEGLSEIVVGGQDIYEPRCWEFYDNIKIDSTSS